MSNRSGLFVNLGALGALGEAALHVEDSVVAALALQGVYVAPFVDCMRASIADADRLPLRIEYRGVKLEIDLNFAAHRRLVLVCKLGHSHSYALDYSADG
jgi:hypothetical protein